MSGGEEEPDYSSSKSAASPVSRLPSPVSRLLSVMSSRLSQCRVGRRSRLLTTAALSRPRLPSPVSRLPPPVSCLSCRPVCLSVGWGGLYTTAARSRPRLPSPVSRLPSPASRLPSPISRLPSPVCHVVPSVSVSGEEEEPAPDYSSSESGASDDEADDSLLRQSIGPRLNVLLSSDSCDDGSTGTGIGTGVGTGSTTGQLRTSTEP